MTFLLCDPGWCVHKSDVQSKWSDRGCVRGVWPHRIGDQDLIIMYLLGKRMPESTATFNVIEAAGQVYSQTNELVYLGGNVNYNADMSLRSIGA